MTNCHHWQGSEQIAGEETKEVWKHFYWAVQDLFHSSNISSLYLTDQGTLPTLLSQELGSSTNQYINLNLRYWYWLWWARCWVNWEKLPPNVHWKSRGDDPKLNITVGRVYLFPMPGFSTASMCQTFCGKSTANKQQEPLSVTHFFIQWQIICSLYVYFWQILNKLQLIVRWNRMKTNFLAARTEADFLVTPESQPCLEHFVANNW